LSFGATHFVLLLATATATATASQRGINNFTKNLIENRVNYKKVLNKYHSGYYKIKECNKYLRVTCSQAYINIYKKIYEGSTTSRWVLYLQ
jgi:hypothetical protein